MENDNEHTLSLSCISLPQYMSLCLSPPFILTPQSAVHSSTGPHQQEDGDEGCHEETPLCRRPGPGGEWQTGITGGLERAVYQTRADRRRMVELREETGMQKSLTERLVRSMLQWAGHVERMADDRLEEEDKRQRSVEKTIR